MESFFATLKKELVHHETYATHSEARHSLFEYIEVSTTESVGTRPWVTCHLPSLPMPHNPNPSAYKAWESPAEPPYIEDLVPDFGASARPLRVPPLL